MPTSLELEVHRFVRDFYTIHDASNDDYLRPSELIGLDWIVVVVVAIYNRVCVVARPKYFRLPLTYISKHCVTLTLLN